MSAEQILRAATANQPTRPALNLARLTNIVYPYPRSVTSQDHYDSTVRNLGLTPADVDEARFIARTTTYRQIDALYVVATLKEMRGNFPELIAFFDSRGITDPAEQIRLFRIREALDIPETFSGGPS